MLINVIRVITHGRKTLTGSEVPILNVALSTRRREDVTSLKVIVFWTPKNVRERCFSLCGNSISDALLFKVEHLNGTIFAS